MSDDYQEYEAACKRIHAENKILLDEFAAWLKNKGLAPRTIDKHIDNVDLYINHFLLYDDAGPAKDGCYQIGMFLGYWFIKKAAWSSKNAIKDNAASLKKFYTFMQEKGEVTKEELQELNETIKEEMPEWQATMSRYVDPDIDDMAEVWGF